VSYPALTRCPANNRHHIMRGHARRFIENQKPIHATAIVAHPATWRMQRQQLSVLALVYSHRLLPVFRRHPDPESVEGEGPPYWLLPLLLLSPLLLPLPLPLPFWLSSRRDLLLLLLLLSQLLLHLR
jgi:hypothetical protein